MRAVMSGIRTRAGLGVIAAVMLVACGPIQTAGIEGSGFSSPAAVSGPITGFGSVFVDGVEYSTAAAQISIDGQPSTEAQLHAGQIVTIEGTVNPGGTTGSATTLTFIGDVLGPVTQIDLVNNTFAVLGQTVRVTSSTVFDEAIQSGDLTGLSANMSVEVSGFADAAGEVVASRVDLAAATRGLQIKGAVQGLDSAAHTFNVNGLGVDYSAVTTSAPLANGSGVVVQGSQLNNSGTLVATHVDVVPAIAAGANKFADLDGIITTFTSTSDFVLLGQHVATSPSTIFILHGLTLAAGVEVNVTGKFDAAGVLQAQTVQVKPFSASLVAGLVDSVNASSNTLSVMGVTISTGAATTFEDLSSQHVRTFRLSDLHTGDYVLVSGTETASGTLEAAALQRENQMPSSYLQGVASNFVQPNFTILGVTVATTAQTQYAGPGGAAGGAATFFSQAPNHVVRAKGTYSGGVLTVTRAQLVQ